MSEPYFQFNEHVFRSDVERALWSVEQILEADRRPWPAEEVHHQYENKFQLANSMTNIAIVAQMNVLERLGLTSEIIQQLDKTKTTTLRFEASESCEFKAEQTVDVVDPYSTQSVTESSASFGSTLFNSSSSTIHKVVKKVKEYHWIVNSHWEITVFSGTEVEKRVSLQSRASSIVVITRSQIKDAPMPKMTKRLPLDLNLTWLLKQIDMQARSTSFTIDMTAAKTPRRNEQVEEALAFFCKRMNSWIQQLTQYFTQTLQPIISKIHNPAVPPPSHPERLASQCSADDLFVPILPLLEEVKTVNEETQALTLDGGNDSDAPTSVSNLSLPATDHPDPEQKCQVLSGKDTIQLLNAQVKSIDTRIQSLEQSYPPTSEAELFSILDATLFLLLGHSEKLCVQYHHAIQYLEKMLEDQLTSAIGKRVTNDDLEEFVRFHNAKFLAIPPRPFCHAVGRPKRFPYGVLSIESKGKGDNGTAIETMMRPVEMSVPLEVQLNAATILQLTGNTYLHGWMHHRSEHRGERKSFELSARARQFSSFMLVIGTMAGPNQLKPKDAIILQNKDEVLIPLLLEEIPSAKEFKDAIESLSPEQQRFAKAFRGMQLESSVFGVAVIQIKPQLESLLGLPEDSLAKEIKLTEDLMELFVEYQVPSDLLSYDEVGDSSAIANEKVECVRQNVKAVMNVIDGTKEKQLEKKTTKADMAVASATTEVYAGQTLPTIGFSPEACSIDTVTERQRRLDALVENLSKESKMFYKPASQGFAARILGSVAKFSGSLSSSVEMGYVVPKKMIERSKGDFALKMQQPVDRGPPPPKSVVANGNPKSATTTALQMDSTETVENTRAPTSISKTNLSSTRAVDFTIIPKTVDTAIKKFDNDSNLRSTKIKTKDTWSRKRQPDLLTKPASTTLWAKDVKSESNKAYDLLDAISRSGSLPIAYSDLHVVVCVTHCFEKDVMATVVEDNVNPIEKLEMSTLLLGSAIHGANPLELIAEESERVRFQSSFPVILEAEENRAD